VCLWLVLCSVVLIWFLMLVVIWVFVVENVVSIWCEVV